MLVLVLSLMVLHGLFRKSHRHSSSHSNELKKATCITEVTANGNQTIRLSDYQTIRLSGRVITANVWAATRALNFPGISHASFRQPPGRNQEPGESPRWLFHARLSEFPGELSKWGRLQHHLMEKVLSCQAAHGPLLLCPLACFGNSLPL